MNIYMCIQPPWTRLYMYMSVPGPQKYAKKMPFGPCSEALGEYITYFCYLCMYEVLHICIRLYLLK